MNSKEIRCIIIDDEIRVRNRLESLLLKLDNISVLSKEGIPEQAIDEVLRLKPDIVFIDVEMPRLTGFDVVKAVREKYCYPTFIFVTAYNQYAIKAIKNGAFDYLMKPVDIDELKNALERYKRLHSLDYDENVMNMPLLSCLSPREKEVLRYVMKGYTSKQIAEKMYISKTTVDTHRKKILEKTEAPRLSDLIIRILSGG